MYNFIGRYKWGDGSIYEGEWFENCLHGYVNNNNFLFIYR